MEGGMKINETVQWAEGRAVSEILELAIALETNSYDLYIKMSQKMTDPGAQEVFARLAVDEKRHLERIALLLEMKI